MSECVTREEFDEACRWIMYELHRTQWMIAGGRGRPPQPPVSPGMMLSWIRGKWQEVPAMTADELSAKRQRQAAHLRLRRAKKREDRRMGSFNFYANDVDAFMREYKRRRDTPPGATA